MKMKRLLHHTLSTATVAVGRVAVVALLSTFDHVVTTHTVARAVGRPESDLNKRGRAGAGGYGTRDSVRRRIKSTSTTVARIRGRRVVRNFPVRITRIFTSRRSATILNVCSTTFTASAKAITGLTVLIPPLTSAKPPFSPGVGSILSLVNVITFEPAAPPAPRLNTRYVY